MGKIVITEKSGRLLLTLFDEKRPCLMETASLPETESMLGNIYLARVKDVVPGINGAFLSLSEGKTAFLPLGKSAEILCVGRELAEGSALRQGDIIVVQIVGEALKTKQPTASAGLSLAGQYCVCDYFGHGISFSGKLDKEKKKRIGDAIRMKDVEGRRGYHFTIRTNAENLESYEPLFREMESFIAAFDVITQVYKYRTLYSCLYHREPEIISLIKNIPLDAYNEIVTDLPEIHKLLTQEFQDGEKNVRLYQDNMIALAKLYSLETHLKEALGRKVWLPGGGYLIIEPTEAMVVIDVNSGKAVGTARKPASNYYLKVNLEAAKEVARQLRIRNYSGMIMVDFINMESDEDNRKLLACLDEYLREDKVKTRLVDMTALGIVEITRKKMRRPLSDYITNN